MSVDQDLAPGAEPIRDHPVATLVMRARNGDELAWDALVERYAPLIWSLCRRYRLDGADAGDVGQNVWLQLVDQLGKIRDPAALPGWLATTTRRECQRVLDRAQPPHAALHASDAENIRTTRPARSSKCWRPSGTRRYARRSRTCRLAVSS
jgi:RNA polymerase sigma factor (sigma-70 family)